MKPFAYARAGRRRRGRRATVAGEPGRGLPGRRHQPRRPPQARRRPPRRCSSTSAGSPRRDRRDLPGRRAAHRRRRAQQRPRRRPRGSASATRCSPRRCWPARPASCATWPPPAATCCSAPAASTSRTSPRPATSASRAPAARRVGGCTRYHAILGRARPRPETCIATHPSDMAVALARSTRRCRCSGPAGERTDPVRRAAPAARRRPVPRHRARARRADHRHRPAAAAGRHAARPTARSATGPPTRSRWSRWPPRSTRDGTSRDVRIALGGVAHKPWRAHRRRGGAARRPPPTERRRPRGRRGRAGRRPAAARRSTAATPSRSRWSRHASSPPCATSTEETP